MTNTACAWDVGNRAAFLLPVLILSTVSSTASSTTILSDDFESYSIGTNLVGQGDWLGTLDPTLILAAGPLPTRVLDGLTNQPGSFFGTARQEFVAPQSLTYTVSFDAYASSSSHNTWGGLSNLSDGSTVNLAMSALWEVDRGTTNGWTFRIRDAYVPTTTLSVPGGLDQRVHLKVTIDPVQSIVFGTYDFGAGPIETARFTATTSMISALNAVNFGFDYRGTVGMQIDNVVVSSIPEPNSFSFLLLGLLGILGTLTWRRARHAQPFTGAASNLKCNTLPPR